jgi:hypothetical protein
MDLNYLVLAATFAVLIAAMAFGCARLGSPKS